MKLLRAKDAAQRFKIHRTALTGGADGADRRCHILRTLHAALDLERGHPHLGEFGNAVRQREVLQRKGIGLTALGLEGQTAGLGTEPTVAAAAANHRAEIALARHRHTQRTMHEHLHLQRGVGTDVADFRSGELSGQYHPGKAQLLAEPCALQVVNAHLGGGVDRQSGGTVPHHPCHCQILGEHSVHTGGSGDADGLHRLVDLVLKHDDVDGLVDLYPAQVAVFHRPAEFLGIKVAGIAAGIEPLAAQIDCIGAALHRRDQ